MAHKNVGNIFLSISSVPTCSFENISNIDVFLDLCDEGQPTVPAHAHRGMFKYEDPLWACDLCFWQWSILQQQQGIFHWFWRVIWGNIWKLTLEINLNFANNVTLHFLESKLGTHVKTHSGDKSYFCKQCDFALILASNLRMHMKLILQTMWLCIFWRVNWGHMLKLILEINRTFANNATLHWFWRVIWGCIWKLTLEINLNFENNDKYANNMLYEQGSHEIRGAFFTDSNELDPAVVTERSMFGLKKVFFLWFEPFW